MYEAVQRVFLCATDKHSSNDESHICGPHQCDASKGITAGKRIHGTVKNE